MKPDKQVTFQDNQKTVLWFQILIQNYTRLKLPILFKYIKQNYIFWHNRVEILC